MGKSYGEAAFQTFSVCVRTKVEQEKSRERWTGGVQLLLASTEVNNLPASTVDLKEIELRVHVHGCVLADSICHTRIMMASIGVPYNHT